MLFVDYVFDLLDNGTIVMDKELQADKIKVKNGDKYVANVTWDGRVIFQKVINDIKSETDSSQHATV